MGGTYIFLGSFAAREVRLSELISPALSLNLTCTYIFLGSLLRCAMRRLSELISPDLSLRLTCTYIFLGSFAARNVRLSE